MQFTNEGPIGLQANGKTGAGIPLTINCMGMSTVAVQVAGTISANYFTLTGGISPVLTPATLAKFTDQSTGAALASGHIVASGVYKVNCAGLAFITLQPHASIVTAGCSAFMTATTAIMDPTP